MSFEKLKNNKGVRMKTNRFSYGVFVMVLGAAFFMMSCGSAPEVKEQTAVPAASLVGMQNEQLAKIPVTGFDYKSSAMPPQKWDRWAKAAAPVVRDIINKLPEGYVLQVTGHTDARGPENAIGNKPGNIKISADRAKAVFNSLRKEGITSPNMIYKGVGSSDLLPGVDPNDPQQRRVSFKVVPKA